MQIVYLVCLLIIPIWTLAQTQSSQVPGAVIVNLDLKNGIVKDEAIVPYGVRLLFKAEVPDSALGVNLDTLYAFYGNGEQKPCPTKVYAVPEDYSYMGGWARPLPTLSGAYTTAEFISEMHPGNFFLSNRNYCLIIRRYKDNRQPDPLQQIVSLRTESKFSDYVKLDFGVGYAPLPKAWFGSLAAHFYIVPVNESINLAEYFKFGRQILMRTSLFVGVAPVTLSSDTKQDIVKASGVGNVIFGVGFRAPFYYPNKKRSYYRLNTSSILIKDSRLNFNQALRLNVGWLLFKQAEASPFILKERTKIAPFISLTYDASLTTVLAPIASLLSGK